MYYFEHITKLPSEIKISLIILLVSIAIGFIAFNIYHFICTIESKIPPFLYKPVFWFRHYLPKKNIDSDFSIVDSANIATESSIRGKFVVVYSAWISVCIFFLIFFSISNYSQTYSIDYQEAIVDLSALENELYSIVEFDDVNIQNKKTIENDDYYLRELQIVINDIDFTLQFCYDKVDKMKKLSIKFNIYNNKNLSNSFKIQSIIFNKYALKNITSKDINDFYSNRNDYTTEYTINNKSVYQYDYSGDFVTLFIIKNQDNEELLISGIIKK